MDSEILKLGRLDYVIKYPADFCPEEKYPLLLCLHGAGTRGKDIALLLNNPFFIETAKLKEFPFIMAAPLCSEDTWFDLWAELTELMKTLTVLPFVDPKRVYMMGASMGGYACWQLAMSKPEYFAAIAPICGGGMYWNAQRLRTVPVWAFHGARDDRVFPEESVKMVEAVNACGGSARLTIYPENGHNAWSDAYSDPELYRWFLSHSRTSAALPSEKLEGSELFG